jgi:hypothetical protein
VFDFDIPKTTSVTSLDMKHSHCSLKQTAMSVIDSEFIYKLSIYSAVIIWLSIASCVIVLLVISPHFHKSIHHLRWQHRELRGVKFIEIGKECFMSKRGKRVL